MAEPPGSRGLVLAIAGLAALSSAASALAEPPPSVVGAVALSELAGLTPSAVRARLAPVAAGWPLPPSFRVLTSNSVLEFVALGDLLLDPVARERLASFQSGGEPGPAPAYVRCEARLDRSGDGRSEMDGPVVLMFRDGQLEKALGPPPPPPHETPPASTERRAWQAFIRRPRSSPFLASLGEVPLEDGAGFLARWGREPLPAADRLTAECVEQPPAPPPVAAGRPKRGLDAGDLQGLALLPFAGRLPGLNRQRVAARSIGAAIMASLHPGEPLGNTPDRFAAEHPGVRFHPGKSAGYGVLSVDLGGYPGRNLTNFNATALVGIRAGRVEWISPPTPAPVGPTPNLLCRDASGVPNTPRPGCHGWGNYSP